IGPGAQDLAIVGGGSARVRAHYSLSLDEILAARFGAGVQVEHAPGCQLAAGPDEAEPGSEEMLKGAATLAREADLAVVVVGTNPFWESEGYDRENMDLPGRQAELVERVLDANPRTVVVLNSGAPVSLPFARRAPAMLQCWFGGQELANALADVLLGAVDPGGRLPVTFPERLEHTPAFGLFPAESSSVRYGEGLLVGYRWYQARHLPVLFPFGHGLSYTAIAVTSARLTSAVLAPGGRLSVDVDVENPGPRAGSEVVQLYVAPPGGGQLVPGGRLRPVKSLKAFAKAHLAPGDKATLKLELNERSFAYYDVADGAWAELSGRLGGEGRSPRGLHRREPGWYVDKGIYELQIGRSCEDICHCLAVEVLGREGPLPPGAPVG
ncbi:MAG TPA: glycoside hydrolase family 3 C-terminal domain-containing protein, partial [Acidimicrobiales bacterium]|nr:glycoside hydrolase family 3 C-terminal domain-containing protein [Acidimicrobiales bacterium]